MKSLQVIALLTAFAVITKGQTALPTCKELRDARASELSKIVAKEQEIARYLPKGVQVLALATAVGASLVAAEVASLEAVVALLARVGPPILRSQSRTFLERLARDYIALHKITLAAIAERHKTNPTHYQAELDWVRLVLNTYERRNACSDQ